MAFTPPTLKLRITPEEFRELAKNGEVIIKVGNGTARLVIDKPE